MLFLKVRQLSILMIRRAVIKREDSLWPKLSPETKAKVKQSLLHGLHYDASPLMRVKLDDTVADLVTHIGAEEWPEVLEELLALSKSEEGMHRESGLLIFGQILNTLSEQLENYIEALRDIFIVGMGDASLEVRIAALRATAGFIISARKVDTKVLLQPLVPPMVQVLHDAIESKNSQCLAEALDVFIDWSLDPLFFHMHFNILLPVMYTISTMPDTQGFQVTALEFLVTLAARQPRIMAQVPNFIQSVSQALMNGLVTMDENPLEDWNTLRDNDLEPALADQMDDLVDQFALSLRGKIMPSMLPLINEMVNNTQMWQARHAAMMALSLIAEGCHQRLKDPLPDIVAMVLARAEDEHPRVRWAALNALGQLAEDFRPTFQTKYHETVMPVLCRHLEDVNNPKVQSSALLALVTFCKKSPPETVIPYMDEVLTRLHTLMSSPIDFVISDCVMCIGAIAILSKEHFIPYYGHFVPILKEVLLRTEEEQFHDLRSVAIDTFSMIGAAVGKETFLADAQEFMAAWAATKPGEYGAINKLRENLIFAAGRICLVLGEHFVPYLSTIVPPLLETATITEDIYLDTGEVTGNGETERDGWDYAIVGNTRYGVHTYALDEKNAAVRMLYSIVDNLSDACYEYIPDISAALAPLTTFSFHEGIRAGAAGALSVILSAVKSHCTKTGDFAPFENLFAEYFENLLKAANEEAFNEALPIMIDAISELIALVPTNALAESAVKSILELQRNTLEEIKKESIDRKKRIDAGEATPDHEADWREIDGFIISICTELADIYGGAVRCHPESIRPLWSTHIDFILSILDDEEVSWMMRQTALCFIGDSAEHLKEPLRPYLLQVLPYLIHYVTDEQPAVRQASAYGLGSIAQHFPEEMPDWTENCIEALLGVIDQEGSRDDENAQGPTENAICALGKFILYLPLPDEQLAELLPRWLTYLPLFVDALEAHICHGILMTIIEANNPHVWGANYENIGMILDIISWCMTDEGLLFITPEIYTRMKAMVVHMHSSAPEMFNEAASALPEAQQGSLETAITQ